MILSVREGLLGKYSQHPGIANGGEGSAPCHDFFGPQVKRRGKDLIWVEVERFQHQDDFEQSALWAEIKETMSSTRNSRNDEAQFKHYRCGPRWANFVRNLIE